MNAQLAMKTYTTISLYGQLGNHAVVRLPGRRQQVREFTCITALGMLRNKLAAG